MSTYDQDEASVQHNEPDEYYDIALSTGVTYRLAQGNRDLQIGSIVYTATPAARSDLDVSQVAKRKEVSVSIPVTHPAIARWIGAAAPPRQVTVTVWRRQRRSLVSRRMWLGIVSDVQVDGNIAKFTIPAKTTATLERYLPTLTSGPDCSNLLYDDGCKVARVSFLVSTTARFVDGRNVHVDMADMAKIGNNWALGGELVHVPTGERMTIAKQTDVDPATSTLTVLSMQFPIFELRYLDAIQVYAGCDHTMLTCNTKFANQPNFIGDPYKSLTNPFFPTGLGTVEQG